MKKITSSKKTKLGQGLLKGLKEAVAFMQGKMSLKNITLDTPPGLDKAQVKEKSNNSFDDQTESTQYYP